MLPSTALRPFIFAKIHGIFSGFRKPEEWLGLLQSGSVNRALNQLPVPEKYRQHGADQRTQEFYLHNALLGAFSDLAPEKGPAGNFFSALFSEYEIKNISLFLKENQAGEEEFYPLPRKTAPLSSLLAGASREIGLQLLSHTEYAPIIEKISQNSETAVLDAALEQHYYSTLHRRALKLPGRDRRAILPILTGYIDIRSVLTVLRNRFGYRQTPEAACGSVYFTDQKIKEKLLTALNNEERADPVRLFPEPRREQIREQLKSIPEDADASTDGTPDPTTLEKAAALCMQTIFRKNFHTNHTSLGPLFCFYFLLKREILNTALLCNSVRLEIPAEEFRRELIY